MSKRKFALFDLDGTLYRSSLFLDTIELLIKQGKIPSENIAEHHRLKKMWLERSHSESYEDFIRAVVKYAHEEIVNIDVADMEYASETIAHNNRDLVYRYTRDLVAKLKKDGYFLIAISGSHQEVVSKFVEQYGFDTFTASSWQRTPDNTRYTGKGIDLGKDKLVELQRLVGENDLTYDGSIGIGDARSDISVLERVEEPIAFNPEEKLLDKAKKEGWKVVVERKNVIYELEQTDGRYLLA